MMRSDQFKCSKCEEYHKLETLIELPKPAISRSDFDVSKPLKYITKDSFVIGRELIVAKCLISIKILDDPDEDTLDIYSWVLITDKDVLEAKESKQGVGNLVLQGRLDKTLPVFQNEEAIIVIVSADGYLEDDLLVTEIVSEGELKNAFDNGITTNELIVIIEKTLHFQVKD